MDDQQDQPVQEAEVIEEASTESEVATASSSPADNQATVLMSLEDMIKKYISRLDQLRIEVKKHKEMYDDGFLSNPTFIENTQKAKAATKDLLVTKKNIASQPASIQLNLKMKTMRDEMKEMAVSLSDYLQEYQRMTGANEIEGEDGKIRDIINSAKLVVRSGKSGK
jgi:hypothetical protein